MVHIKMEYLIESWSKHPLEEAIPLDYRIIAIWKHGDHWRSCERDGIDFYGPDSQVKGLQTVYWIYKDPIVDREKRLGIK